MGVSSVAGTFTDSSWYFWGMLPSYTSNTNNGRLLARKANRRSRRSNTNPSRSIASSDPRAMSTVRAAGPRDPPQTTTNVVGFKRIRKTVILTANVGSMTIGDLRNCLPLTTPELRIMKLSVWSSDTDTLSCVFPVGQSNNTNPGDNSVWSDDGTPGALRAQIHLVPCFEYRNFWFQAGVSNSTVVATFGSNSIATGNLIVDVTLQFRTAVQSCPALDHLNELMLQESDDWSLTHDVVEYPLTKQA